MTLQSPGLRTSSASLPRTLRPNSESELDIVVSSVVHLVSLRPYGKPVGWAGQVSHFAVVATEALEGEDLLGVLACEGCHSNVP